MPAFTCLAAPLPFRRRGPSPALAEGRRPPARAGDADRKPLPRRRPRPAQANGLRITSPSTAWPSAMSSLNSVAQSASSAAARMLASHTE